MDDAARFLREESCRRRSRSRSRSREARAARPRARSGLLSPRRRPSPEPGPRGALDRWRTPPCGGSRARAAVRHGRQPLLQRRRLVRAPDEGRRRGRRALRRGRRDAGRRRQRERRRGPARARRSPVGRSRLAARRARRLRQRRGALLRHAGNGQRGLRALARREPPRRAGNDLPRDARLFHGRAGQPEASVLPPPPLLSVEGRLHRRRRQPRPPGHRAARQAGDDGGEPTFPSTRSTLRVSCTAWTCPTTRPSGAGANRP